jgi:hypothetical protein
MMTGNLLPAAFTDLDPFVKHWALPRESERNNKRISSSMDDLQRFYDAMLPRIGEAAKYLDQFPLDEMPADALRLLHLSLSLMEISMAVEVLGQPNMPDSVEDSRFEFTSERKGTSAANVPCK